MKRIQNDPDVQTESRIRIRCAANKNGHTDNMRAHAERVSFSKVEGPAVSGMDPVNTDAVWFRPYSHRQAALRPDGTETIFSSRKS